MQDKPNKSEGFRNTPYENGWQRHKNKLAHGACSSFQNLPYVLENLMLIHSPSIWLIETGLEIQQELFLI